MKIQHFMNDDTGSEYVVFTEDGKAEENQKPGYKLTKEDDCDLGKVESLIPLDIPFETNL